MLKMLGAMLIIAACTSLGLKIVIKKRKTLNAIRELSGSLGEIAHSIDFRLDPLPDVICRLSQDLFSEENTFIKQLARQIEKRSHQPLSLIWQAVLSQFSRENALPAKAESVLSSLGESLGKMDYETEIDRLHAAQNSLMSLLEEMEGQHEKTEKMVKSLGIILGIFIVIILL
ncbi:MAG: stage III sporulation protein AB [Clostridia bacterium]|nr:stage III sporulation protein AB [Clostridia bacterium]